MDKTLTVSNVVTVSYWEKSVLFCTYPCTKLVQYLIAKTLSKRLAVQEFSLDWIQLSFIALQSLRFIPLLALGGLESFLLAALVGLDPFFDPADGGRLPAWDGGLLPVSGFGDLAEVGRELGLAEVGLDPALEPMG